MSAPPLPPYTEFHNTGEEVSDPSNPSSKVIAGAAGAGLIAGMMVSGPVVGLVAGAGAAVATMTKGTAGDVARSAGNLGAAAGSKAVELDKKHHIVDKTKAATSGLVAKAKDIDKKHGVVDKTKAGAIKAASAASDFNKKHDITGKTAKALSSGMDAVSRRLSKK